MACQGDWRSLGRGCAGRLIFAQNGKLLTIKVVALGARRGPASGRAGYGELDAEAFA